MERNPSPWMAARERKGDESASPSALEDVGKLDVDVAVVGAGFTGLSTALSLAEAGLSVAVIEANHVGFGASGRNAGHLTPTIGKDPKSLTTMFGKERAGRLLQLSNRAIEYVEALIAKHSIDCSYEPVGNVVAAVHSDQHAAIEKAARAAEEHGVGGELLDEPEMRRRGLPGTFTLGFFEPKGGILHPGRFVCSLADAARRAGAAIYEDSPVTKIRERGERVSVSTPRGEISARHVVIGTNAYTRSLGRLRSRAVRLQVQLFRTEPLTDAQKARIGWTGREGIYTAHEALESYRWTDDGRLLGGSKFVRYAYGSNALPDVDAKISAELEATFRARFPELEDVAVTDTWGGPIGMNLNFLPAIGRTGKHKNIVYAIGYAGHGLAHATYAGVVVSDLIQQGHSEDATLLRPGLPVPPEPFTWLAVRAIAGFLERRDRRVDAKVTSS
jgi:gamma-glutamylputrescine oxidase